MVLVAPFAPASAQSSGDGANFEPPPEDDDFCRRKQEAALISGEIVVCGDREQNDSHRLSPPAEARSRYAEETQTEGLALAPDFAPPPCQPSLLTWCPTFGGASQAAYLIDFATLPDAPTGSDADRIARGELAE